MLYPYPACFVEVLRREASARGWAWPPPQATPGSSSLTFGPHGIQVGIKNTRWPQSFVIQLCNPMMHSGWRALKSQSRAIARPGLIGWVYVINLFLNKGNQEEGGPASTSERRTSRTFYGKFSNARTSPVNEQEPPVTPQPQRIGGNSPRHPQTPASTTTGWRLPFINQ